ncbi:MAG: ribokinase [Bryobacterales bacterium]|nr:ribokinase [Bryobacterales bacterium]
MAGGILVVGSLNCDYVATVARMPAPGETLSGLDLQIHPGGKGANQAVAAGRMTDASMEVRMLGCVGRDAAGALLLDSVRRAGVETDAISELEDVPTGSALIWVEASGQNSIVVIPGANARLSPDDIRAQEGLYWKTRVALHQLETPLETVHAALALGRQRRVITILDPAPAQTLPAEMLDLADLLTPNESEAAILLGEAPRALTVEDAYAMGDRLLELGTRAVILKLGAEGAVFLNRLQRFHVPGFAVRAVDTTAAGDTFNGALAAAIAEGMEMQPAVRFACAASALSVTRRGAQPSVPSRDETEALLAANPEKP